MRADLFAGGDPALLIDIDDQTIPQPASRRPGRASAPMATAPRGVIADALEYVRAAPPGKGAAAAIVDIDLATPHAGRRGRRGQAASGTGRLGENAVGPRADDHAPVVPRCHLRRRRQPAGPARLPTMTTSSMPAPNIMWASGEMMARPEYAWSANSCPTNASSARIGPTVLYSASLLAYGFLRERPDSAGRAGANLYGSSVAKSDCANPRRRPIRTANWSTSTCRLGKGENGRVWPELTPDWRGLHALAGRGPIQRCSGACRPATSPPPGRTPAMNWCAGVW